MSQLQGGSRLRRNSIAGSILAFLAVIAVSVLTPQSALAASRFGCTSFGPGFSVGNVSVKDGASCVYVEGQGLRIDKVYAEFHLGVTKVCNWWMDIDTDAVQPVFRHFQGSFHNGCTKFSGIVNLHSVTFFSNPGRVCGTLFENAVIRAKSCVTIHT